MKSYHINENTILEHYPDDESYPFCLVLNGETIIGMDYDDMEALVKALKDLREEQ